MTHLDHFETNGGFIQTVPKRMDEKYSEEAGKKKQAKWISNLIVHYEYQSPCSPSSSAAPATDRAHRMRKMRSKTEGPPPREWGETELSTAKSRNPQLPADSEAGRWGHSPMK